MNNICEKYKTEYLLNYNYAKQKLENFGFDNSIKINYLNALTTAYNQYDVLNIDIYMNRMTDKICNIGINNNLSQYQKNILRDITYNININYNKNKQKG